MKFDWIAGTGGIGKGEIFRLIGDATLGREESRSAWNNSNVDQMIQDGFVYEG